MTNEQYKQSEEEKNILDDVKSYFYKSNIANYIILVGNSIGGTIGVVSNFINHPNHALEIVLPYALLAIGASRIEPILENNKCIKTLNKCISELETIINKVTSSKPSN